MSLKASVYSDTVANTMQWQETHSVTTNDVGIFSVVLGTGFAGVGSVQTAFANIDWNASTHYIKIELDHGSGFMDYGTTALQSVPYALAAETADEANAVDWININNIPTDIADGDDVDDADNDSANEIQTITLSGDTLYISGGNNVDLSGYNAGIFANDSNVTSNANGDYATDDFVFGAPTIDYDANTSNGIRMFFDKSTGSFRAGESDNTNWDTDSLGHRSFATGYRTKATGFSSTAMGFGTKATGYVSTAMGEYTNALGYISTAMGSSTEASGSYSTAMGFYTEATGNASTAMGIATEASGLYSTAIGSYTDASGDYSTAMGKNTEAPGSYSTAMGRYNVGGGDPTTWVATDPLFEIGNGTSSSNKSNAFTIYKDGNAEVSENITSNNGDFYTGASDGVINCGGGVMSANLNYIGDSYSAPSNVAGDEDLYIEDDFQVGGVAYKPGGGTWATASDARLKTDITPFTDGLSKVLQINPVRFRYNEKSGFANLEKQYIGVLAQDVLNVAPYMVKEENFWQKVEEDENGVEKIIDEGEKFYTFDSSAFDYMLINAFKEQQKIIKKLEERITQLENN